MYTEVTPSEPTTTLNDCQVGKAHPNIYEFVQVIQKEQTVTEVFVLQLEAGARPPQRTLKAINTDRKIQELKNALILIKLH